MRPDLTITRRLVRIAEWTLGWVLFEWWAVIGWPETLEGNHAALLLASVGSIVGWTGWYGLQRLVGGTDATIPPEAPQPAGLRSP